MRIIISTVVLVVLCSAPPSHAQPGSTPVAPAPPAPPPYGQPPPYVPPPYAYQPQPIQLTAGEQELLRDGEISDGQHIGGGIASLFVGFGLGQAIQGRWTDTGWIFTLGEGVSFGVMVDGLVKALDNCPLFSETSCDDSRGENEFLIGLGGFAVFHIWEVVDAFVVPPRHNRRVRELRARLGYPPPSPYYGVVPFVKPVHGDGGVAGITLRF